MDLSRVLRVTSRSRIAFAGAGGKTSAMFRLARQFGKQGALISATTHLAIEQLKLGDVHQIVKHSQGTPAPPNHLMPGVAVYTGEPVDGERVKGLSLEGIARLGELADELDVPLFIEADGSRRLPLKAPAEHEPLIPAFINQVVYVVGLSAIGLPLTSETVHRPEKFAKLCDSEIGEIITPEMISSLLLHREGGLKGIPPAASRWALLNQAGTDDLQSIGFRITADLLPDYWGAAVADIPHYSEWEGQTVDIQTMARDVLSVRVPTAGVILAAGGATRMGKPKQVLPWRGEPLVVHVARAALGAGLDPVIVVGGASTQDVALAVAGLPVKVVHNASWDDGQSTSIKAGLSALPPQTGAVVFLQADQPLVTPMLIGGLVEAHAQSMRPTIAPLIDGQRSSPVLFDRVTFTDLAQIEGDVGGRSLFARYSPQWIDWHDPRARLDIDTEADYAHLLEEYP